MIAVLDVLAAAGFRPQRDHTQLSSCRRSHRWATSAPRGLHIRRAPTSRSNPGADALIPRVRSTMPLIATDPMYGLHPAPITAPSAVTVRSGTLVRASFAAFLS